VSSPPLACCYLPLGCRVVGWPLLAAAAVPLLKSAARARTPTAQLRMTSTLSALTHATVTTAASTWGTAARTSKTIAEFWTVRYPAGAAGHPVAPPAAWADQPGQERSHIPQPTEARSVPTLNSTGAAGPRAGARTPGPRTKSPLSERLQCCSQASGAPSGPPRHGMFDRTFAHSSSLNKRTSTVLCSKWTRP